MKYQMFFFTFVVLAAPAVAFETEEIGILQAAFDGKAIALPTLMVKSDDEEQAMAFLHIIGGFSNLSLTGLGMDNARLDISAGFMFDTPSPNAPVFELTIDYAPTGTGQHWTSEEVPNPPTITFTTLEFDEVEGRAAGTFAGEVCYADGYGTDADPDNCKPIEGSFDTQFFME